MFSCRAQSFSMQIAYNLRWRGQMKKDDAKTAVQALRELSESYVEVGRAVKDSDLQVNHLRRLSRDGNKSRLIKIGLSLIVFPEPTPISETVGACFVAAGVIQQGIKNQSIYIEDIPKTLQQTLNEVRSFKDIIGL
jgi:hypothetical protein